MPATCFSLRGFASKGEQGSEQGEQGFAGCFSGDVVFISTTYTLESPCRRVEFCGKLVMRLFIFFIVVWNTAFLFLWRVKLCEAHRLTAAERLPFISFTDEIIRFTDKMKKCVRDRNRSKIDKNRPYDGHMADVRRPSFFDGRHTSAIIFRWTPNGDHSISLVDVRRPNGYK